MSISVALLGAGGKMGFRVVHKLSAAGYDLRAVDTGAEGRDRLASAGIEPVCVERGIDGADVVVMAIPDDVIGRVATDIFPQLKPNAMLLVLDAAAPYANALPESRGDISVFVGHPCHPPLFNEETDWEARRDYHGGIARQSIVCSLMRGTEADYVLGEAICKVMWAPIINCHRVTTEQLAILEPGLSEMIAMPFVDTMVEALEECEAKYGIPRQAALDFLIGHLNVEIAMWFGFSPKVPSDAALRLMHFAKQTVIKSDWRDALAPKKVKEAAELIVYGESV